VEASKARRFAAGKYFFVLNKIENIWPELICKLQHLPGIRIAFCTFSKNWRIKFQRNVIGNN